MKIMSLGKKIALGFGCLIAISCLLGGIAIYNMKSAESIANRLASEFVPESAVAGILESSMSSAQLAILSYGFTGENSYLNEAHKILDKVHLNQVSAQKLADEYPDLVKLKEQLKEFAPQLKRFEDLVAQTELMNKQISDGRNELNKAAAEFSSNIEGLITSQNINFQKEIQSGVEAAKLQERRENLVLATDVSRLASIARLAAFKSQALRDPSIMEDGLKNFEEMDSKFDLLLTRLHLPDDISRLNNTKVHAHLYRDTMKKMMASSIALADIGNDSIQAGERLRDDASSIHQTGMKSTVDTSQNSSRKLSASSWA
ncbi:MAG: chemotaxis protein, partial [Verrucomicrobiales bacterium]|nr:chemotaxis protein [Verrucomicrobiales bacterium]